MPTDDRKGSPRVGRRTLLAGAAAGLGGLAGGMVLSRGAAQGGPGAQPSPGAPSPSPTPDPRLVQSQPVQDLARTIYNNNPFLFGAPVDQLEGLITPNRVHFVRNHYDSPTVDAGAWQLRVEGAVASPLTLTLADLKAMPSRTVTCFIECSGNSRGQFQPRAAGTQWANDAISVAQWTGVPLADLLTLAGVAAATVDVVAEGGDSGKVYSAIPWEKALDPDTIVAYAQNGEALNRENGYPVRLVAPGWGGIRSIKWLARIEAVAQRFVGFYNDRYYVYETPGLPKTPVQALGVKSFITRPAADATLPAGRPATIAGVAYSGLGAIARVEVSVDGGQSWADAALLEPVLRWAWVRWQFRWGAPVAGSATLRSRATDTAGNLQPETVAWNRYGYGNNAIQSRAVTVA